MSSSRINQFKIRSKDFKIIREINKGAFGVVYAVEEKETNERYAAKVIFTGNAQQSREMVNREVQIMIRVTHPTLIRFRGFSMTDFTGNKNITIFMELIENGSLEEILDNVQRGLSDDKYDNTARQIILVGISYGMMILHQHYVIHRDLKPGNILIDKYFYPHLTDFGLSKFIDSDHSKSQSKSCGTPCYMAPEVIDGNHYDGKADVYSFGILMYQIVTDSRPYPLFDKGKIKEFRLNQKIVDEDYRPTFDVPVKKSIKKLIEKCWSKNPKNRPTFEEIFNRLAYNRECAIYDIFFDDDDEEDNDDDETPYYLEGVKVEELFSYLDIITENNATNRKSDDDSTTEKLTQKVAKMEKLIEKVIKENSEKDDFISEQKERINKLELLVQNQKEQMKKQDNEIQNQKEQMKKQDNEIQNQKEQMKKQDNEIQNQKEQIVKQNIESQNQIEKLNEQIIELNRQVKELNDSKMQDVINKASPKKHYNHESSDSNSMSDAVKKRSLAKRKPPLMKAEVNERNSSSLEISKIKPSRYIEQIKSIGKNKITNESNIKTFSYEKGQEFKGIIQHLTNKFGQNIDECGIIKVTSNHTNEFNPPKNILDFNSENLFASSTCNNQDKWICFDFKNYEIKLSNYSIKSGSDGGYVKNWVIEISNDGNNWIQIDERTDYSELNGSNLVKTFEIQSKNNKFSQFIRFRHTGDYWDSFLYLRIHSIEFYGQIKEKI